MLAYLSCKATSNPVFKIAMFLSTCYFKNVHCIEYTFCDMYTLNKITDNIVCHMFPVPKPEIQLLHCAQHHVAKKDTLESVEA